MWLILLATVLSCASSQYVKTANYGVKGGSGGGQGYQYNAQENIDRFYGNSTQQHGYGYSGGQHYSPPLSQVGVCYIEVPTASLVRGSAHVPTGNGSRPDLSRIHSCCSGYIRNIHNHQICDPVCTEECINALCTAPETCSCFPDHVKNAAGFCIATCPIGCQNGQCAGGECLCKDGYTLDSNGRYCLPKCNNNCGGVGNCTAPNTCTCKPGYQSTPEGSCKVTCDKPCDNGDCVAPNDCRCRAGYTKDQQGLCVPHCAQSCGPTGRCISPNVCSNPTTNAPAPLPIHGSTPSYYQHYPNYPHQPTNSSSNYPHSPNDQNPYYSNHGNQPYYPSNNSPYYPTDNLNRPTYNITSDSQVRPNIPNNQTSHGPGANYPTKPIYQSYPGPNQPQSSYPQNQAGYYPSGPYQSPTGLNNSDINHPPTNQHYYPYYPDQGNQMGSPNYPNQQGSTTGQVNQHGYNNNQPNQPGYQPNQPNQPGYQPNQPNQPGYQPNQPGYQPNQPGYQPNQPHSSYPGSQGQPNPNSTNPYDSLYPQLPNYPHSYDQTGAGMIPQCSEPCISGICVEGNRCSCNPGYISDNADPTGRRCIPFCPGGCNNGVCSAPNLCLCNVGFRKEQGVKGRSGCVKRIRRAAEP